MRHVFGPVPSRRLGRSLGIDPIPLKTCNWNCVYCQLGRTRPLVNERRNYVPAEEVIEEVQQSLRTHRPGDIDWVTFIGSGEPTLHDRLGWMIREVKAMTSVPVAVVTNGSLLYKPEVREALAVADAVLPSLDAGTAALYRTVNRPHPECSFERLVRGLIDFRARYQGKLWVEVMLVKALNDTEAALEGVTAILSCVHPDEIHISSPVRPPAEPWVEPPSEEGLARATAILGDPARVLSIAPGSFDVSGFDNVVEALTAIIVRHPMEEEALLRALSHWPPGHVTETLVRLAAEGDAQVVSRYGKRFWSSRKARYQPHTTRNSVKALRF